MKKYFLYICTFIIFSLCSLFIFDFNVEAATTSSGLITEVDSFGSSQSFDLNFTYYNDTAEWSSSSEIVSNGYVTIAGGWYEVFHVKHVFQPTFQFLTDTYGRDFYRFRSYDTSRAINININDPGITSGYIENVERYYQVNVGGNIYKTDLIYLDVMHNASGLGMCLFNPVIEFDVVLSMDSSVSSDSNSYSLNINFVGGSVPLSLYGYNHSTGGDGVISDSIDSNTTAIIGMNNNLSNLFSNLSSLISNLFSNLTTHLTNQFDRLLNQDNTQHQQTINGYQGTGTNDASDTFDQGAEELEEAESDLTNITNSSFNSYSEDAFNTSVITSLGSSLVYVVTWFTNFWNMGGIFTSILNVGLALSVAFFILRLRGGS